ncbi:calcium-binding protein [Inquilinus sp. CA228]|uniref:calcium-binding protein n=1 Tax=Inquilinus sp. CA228 TaxID=3455609 RepID=UPI003F8D814D
MPVFWGTAAADAILGSAGADQIYGQAGNDTLYGSGGDDWLNGGLGNDLMGGGLGNDVYYVAAAGDAIVERVGEGTDSVLAWVSYQLAANVEALILQGATAINGTGNALNNTILGNAGNNVLNGAAGDDQLVGGKGNDIYLVGAAGDRVVEQAGEGFDQVQAWVSHQLAANVEALILQGAAAINGTGNALNNTIIGNAGNNILNGGTGNDTLVGGDGGDVYDVDSAGDRVQEAAGGGRDLVRSSVSFALGANLEELTLIGAAAINGTGNALANTITGNAGNNLLNGAAGNDLLIGGKGDDIYYAAAAGDRVVELAGEGLDQVVAWISYRLTTHVENLTLAGTADLDGAGNYWNNTIIGNAGNNALSGGVGDDLLIGGDGADKLYGDAGRDRLYGGAGNDTFYVEIAHFVVGEVYDGGAGADGLVIDGNGVIDLFALSLVSVEAVAELLTQTTNISCQQINNLNKISVSTLNVHNSGFIDLSDMAYFNVFHFNLSGFGNVVNVGSSFADLTVSGGAGDDTITGGTGSIGGGGDDTLVASTHGATLRGGAGDDTVSGGAGGDLLYDGAGVDDVFGAGGSDYLFLGTGDVTLGDRYDGGSGRDTIEILPISDIDISAAEISGFEYLSSFGKIRATASQIDSFSEISGSTIELTTSGIVEFSGRDVIYIREIILSSQGNTVEMGSGSFFVTGGAGNDVINGGNFDDVNTGGAGNDVLSGRGGQDALSGEAGDDYLRGDANGDSLVGDDGNDTLSGGDGGDYLVGGAGNNLLTGGAGDDYFRFSALSDGRDTISDFSSAQGDRLEFEYLLHGSFSYRGATAFTASGNSEARFEGGMVLVDADGNGVADITIILTGFSAATQLTAANFTIW